MRQYYNVVYKPNDCIDHGLVEQSVRHKIKEPLQRNTIISFLSSEYKRLSMATQDSLCVVFFLFSTEYEYRLCFGWLNVVKMVLGIRSTRIQRPRLNTIRITNE